VHLISIRSDLLHQPWTLMVVIFCCVSEIEQLKCKKIVTDVVLVYGNGWAKSFVELKILQRPTLVGMTTKFQLKLAITRLICETSRRFLRLAGGFRGKAIYWCQSNSSTTDPGCHGNEMWIKIRYNLGCMRDISEIFASNRGVLGVGLFNDVSQILPRPTLVANLPWQRNLS